MAGIIAFFQRDGVPGAQERGEFAEWAKVHDYYYGTPQRTVGSKHRERDAISSSTLTFKARSKSSKLTRKPCRSFFCRRR